MTNLKFPPGVAFHLNETGDFVSEKPPSELPPQRPTPESEVVCHSYRYDSYGNWTEQTTTRADGPEYLTHRELMYY